MTQPYRPPGGSPRGWRTKLYDPHVTAPPAGASVSLGTPTVWCGRNVTITPPPARAVIAGELRTGSLPASFPFSFGAVSHQPVISVEEGS